MLEKAEVQISVEVDARMGEALYSALKPDAIQSRGLTKPTISLNDSGLTLTFSARDLSKLRAGICLLYTSPSPRD